MRHIRSVFRFVLLFVATFGIYGLWLILTLFIPNKVYWRQLILGWWAASFVRIAKCKIEIIGDPPKAPFFLVANHLGYFDIPVVRAARSDHARAALRERASRRPCQLARCVGDDLPAPAPGLGPVARQVCRALAAEDGRCDGMSRPAEVFGVGGAWNTRSPDRVSIA